MQPIFPFAAIIKAPIVLYDTDGYYRPLKAVLDNVVSADFGRAEYFSKVLISEDIEKIAAHCLLAASS